MSESLCAIMKRSHSPESLAAIRPAHFVISKEQARQPVRTAIETYGKRHTMPG